MYIRVSPSPITQPGSLPIPTTPVVLAGSGGNTNGTPWRISTMPNINLKFIAIVVGVGLAVVIGYHMFFQ